MSCGTPVIAMDEGGPSEIIDHGKTGYLSTRDQTLYSKYIKRILNDKFEYNKMANLCRQTVVEKWSNLVLSKNTIDIINNKLGLNDT